jgi:predicted NAD/FAD-dependent oxidoreductase
MGHHRISDSELASFQRGAPRVAVIGAGISGLSCARELVVRGYVPVLFEASDRLGGRCSSLNTRMGWFDDGAQMIVGPTRLPAYATTRPGMLAAIHPWTQPIAPTDTDHQTKAAGLDDGEALEDTTLELMGTVGVPSMAALADEIALPLDVRLNTSIDHVYRLGESWVLRHGKNDVDEDFQAVVLALPAPLALPLAVESCSLSTALGAVRYRNRWVLLLGSERAVGLPSHQAFQGGPIERIAAMHSKPGRPSGLPQRWFIEASERWSHDHRLDDAETVAELLLDNFQACARRTVVPSFLMAHQWQHAYADTPTVPTEQAKYWWDDNLLMGVCGDSVVASQVDLVHRSGALLAARIAESLIARRWRTAPPAQSTVRWPTYSEYAETASPRL